MSQSTPVRPSTTGTATATSSPSSASPSPQKEVEEHITAFVLGTAYQRKLLEQQQQQQHQEQEEQSKRREGENSTSNKKRNNNNNNPGNWQDMVAGAATQNAQADSNAYSQAGFIPSSSSSSSSDGKAGGVVVPLDKPWQRWDVEARLNSTLLPAEKRRIEDNNQLVEEQQKFEITQPRAPVVNRMLVSPNNNKTITTPQKQQQQQQQQQNQRNRQQQQERTSGSDVFFSTSTPRLFVPTSPLARATAAAAATSGSTPNVSFIPSSTTSASGTRNNNNNYNNYNPANHLTFPGINTTVPETETPPRNTAARAWQLQQQISSPTYNHHNNTNTASSPQHQQQQQQQQQQNSVAAVSRVIEANEAENFLLRERVLALEQQLELVRAREGKTAKKRRHQRTIAQSLAHRNAERLAFRYWLEWRRFLEEVKKEEEIKAAVEKYQLSTMSSSSSSSRRVGTKRQNSSSILSPASSPPYKKGRNNQEEEVDDDDENLSPHSSPYRRMNANVLQNKVQVPGLNQSSASSSASKNVATSPIREKNKNSVKTEKELEYELEAQENEEERKKLEKRVEQLTLRCMDQDEVIRTLFVELAAVGQELNNTPTHQVQEPQVYISPQQASMLIRQAVDVPDHSQTQGVVPSPNNNTGGRSGWPHFPYSQNVLQVSPFSVQNLPPKLAEAFGKLFTGQDEERRKINEEEASDFGVLYELFSLGLTPSATNSPSASKAAAAAAAGGGGGIGGVSGAQNNNNNNNNRNSNNNNSVVHHVEL